MPPSRKPIGGRAAKTTAPRKTAVAPRKRAIAPRKSPPKTATASHSAAPTSLRELSKERTRQALIEAALAAFAKDGLDGPSLDAICERAGCTRGAFYVHFADRDALIVAAMAERRNAVVSAFLSAAPGAISTLKVLDLFAAAVESGAFPPPGAVRTQDLLAACRRSTVIRNAQLDLMNQLRDRLSRNIEADQAQGRLRTDVDPRELSALVLVLEAGVELLLDLGYSLHLRRTVAALQTLVSPGASVTK